MAGRRAAQAGNGAFKAKADLHVTGGKPSVDAIQRHSDRSEIQPLRPAQHRNA